MNPVMIKKILIVSLVFGFSILNAQEYLQWQFQTDASKQNYFEIYSEEGGFDEDFELYGADYLESERKIHELGSVLSTPVIWENKIYFGSSDGNLYAVKLK